MKGETIKDFSSRLIEVVNQTKAYGSDIMDQKWWRKS
jgi:hypothetical protein